MMPPQSMPAVRSKSRRPSGTILVVTLWIVLVLAGLVLVLARTMRVEAICSANDASGLAAQAIEYGAIQYVLEQVDSLGGTAPDPNTPCEMVRIGDGAFWILRPSFDDPHAYAYGIVDEGSKVNLNTAPPAMLSMLPYMTDELAACIFDWRNTDGNATPGGAKSEYYLLLKDPYQCKSAPFETVEEMFLVKGATSEIIFGEDTNRNGVLDLNEDDGATSDPVDNHDDQLDRGLYPFVTAYSMERNVGADGNSKININEPNQGLALANLMQTQLSSDRAGEVMVRARRGRPFANVLDFYARTGLTSAEFPKVAGYLTTTANTVIRGRINVNTAPQQVLACLPGLDDSDVSALISKRSQTDTDPTSLAWVAAALPSTKLAAIGDYITAATCRYSADIVSLAGDGRAFRRCRIVVDARTSPPKVIYRQDLTNLGWPLDTQIIANARIGVSLDAQAAGKAPSLEARR